MKHGKVGTKSSGSLLGQWLIRKKKDNDDNDDDEKDERGEKEEEEKEEEEEEEAGAGEGSASGAPRPWRQPSGLAQRIPGDPPRDRLAQRPQRNSGDHALGAELRFRPSNP